jgi:Ca2+-binding RTX toxin-like protein
MLQVSFKPQTAVDQTNSDGHDDGTLPAGYVRFSDIVSTLITHPENLLDFSINVGATGGVDASVPGADNFLSSTPHVGFHWNDLTDLTLAVNPTDPGPYLDLSQLNPFDKFDFDPSNPKALFSIILKTLQTLDSSLGNANPSSASIFNTKIPLVGRSLSDLLKSDESGSGPDVTYTSNTVVDNSRSLANNNVFPQSLVGRSIVAGTQVGIISAVTDNTLTVTPAWTNTPSNGSAYVLRSELDDVISILTNSPSDNLQALMKTLNDRLGHDTPITFDYLNDDGTLTHDPAIVIKLDWKRDFHTSAPVNFDFHLPIGDQSLAGVQGKGSVSLDAGGEIKVGLVVPLVSGTPSDLLVSNDSGISVKLKADVKDASLATTIGPLSLSLGNPNDTDLAAKAQAHANYSVDIGKPSADGTPEDFSTFISEVTPTINGSSDPVDCGFGDSTPLAMCATLPLYISDDGGTTYTKLIDPGDNAFNLRLPKTTTPDSDYFDITSTASQIDGHDRLETPDPGQLGTAIEKHIIDFTRLDGLDSFLNLIEQSMNVASFGGKLPLIGNDLQQGADFIGKLRDSIHTALGQLPGDGHFSDMAGIRDWVNNKLQAALSSAGLNPDLVSVDTVCSSQLDTATAPTVANHPSDTTGSTPFNYEIAAYINVGSDKEQSKVSDPGMTATGPDSGLSPSARLDLTWSPVTGANGYKIFRDTGGGNYQEVGDVTTTNFTDDGSSTPGAGPGGPTDASDNPKLHDCSYDKLDAVEIRADVSQGDFSGDTLKCGDAPDPPLPAGHECIKKSVPLNIGVPGLELRADQAGDGPSVELGYRLHLAFGISRSKGFFVDTKDGDPQPELALGLNFTLPSQVDAQLAFINITAKNCDNTDTQDCETGGPHPSPAPGSAPPLFAGTFKIDMVSPHSDGLLTIDDLGSASLDDLFKVKLHAGLAIDWLLKAKVGDDAGFPGIQTNFKMYWSWNNTDPTTDDGGGLYIAFDKVAIDAGAVLGHVVGPIIQEIKKVTGPLDPVVKTLYAPIPVLSDLSHLVGGGDVTIVSIAKAFSTIAGGPDLTFVDTIVQLIKVVNNLPAGSDHFLIPIGSFVVAGSDALNTTATPDNTQSLIDSGGDTQLTSNSDNSNGNIENALDNHDDNKGPLLDPGPAAAAGFSFPIFEHPAKLFNVIMGGDVDLVKFDSGPLTLGFDWLQEFGPVYAPPPVLITLHGSASVTLRIVAGFDTYGIRKAFEAVRNGEAINLTLFGDAILQSLFFYTTDDKGKPMPVVTFTGSIAAGAEVSAVIITVGIEGGVQLTISFLWNDPNNDGKFRISEFLQTVLNNPICLFVVSGQLSVFLKLFVKIGIGPFSVSFDVTIVNVVLLDFSATPNCKPPPPKLGGLTSDGKTLVVYAGAYGHTAQRGGGAGDPYEDNSEDKDTVKVTEVHDYSSNPPTFKGIAIEMLGIRREFDNSNIERVIVDGRGYGKPMSVTFVGDGKADTSPTGGPPPTASFDKDAIVFGGSDVDTIKTGIGNSWVDGGPGNDGITTGDRTVLVQDPVTKAYSYVRDDAKAIVAGGGGDDSITVGNGNDTVAGDSSLGAPPTTTLSLTDLLNDGRDSGDPLASGQGQAGATVTVPDWTSASLKPADGTGGSDGNDVIKAGLGSDTVYGNGGDDTLGIGADNQLVKTDPAQKSLFVSAGSTLVGGAGNDKIAGGTGDDQIFTASQTTFGVDDPGPADPGATNVVDTGTGSDHVYGSTGVDLVTGHSQKTESDDIRGGDGDDVLIGGYGTDSIYGGPGNDNVIAEPSNVDLSSPSSDGFGTAYPVTHMDLPTGITPSMKLLVGGLGADHIIGGDGGAQVYGDQQTTKCVAGSPVASDPVDESVDTVNDGNDMIIGGAGVENGRAGGGNDYVDAKASNDVVCGEKGDDTLIGGPDDDQVWGGSGNDVVEGDSGNDKLYGNDGNDAIYGNDGNDQIEGNNGTDWATGGNGDDVVIGGTRKAGRADQADYLFGDNGKDTIIGDNGDLVFGVWVPLDLDNLTPSAGGGDFIWGGDGDDTCHGGIGDDTIYAGNGNDHCEGNAGKDTINGEAGEDELVGGGYEQSGTGVGYPDDVDTINGGTGNDVITGDNAIVAGSVTPVGSSTDTVQGRGFTLNHTIQLLDLGYSPTNGTSAGDFLHGNDGNDVIYGQGGDDTITGDANDDYAEGGPGKDTINGNDGQDDIVGGSSTPCALPCGPGSGIIGQPDVGDILHGDANEDVIIGDNGKVLRVTPYSPLTQRDGSTMAPRGIVLYDLGDTPHANSSGGDDVTGDDSVDVILGQGGNDRLKGNAGDDYIEGDSDSDWIEGNAGNDDLVGGSSHVFSGSGTSTAGELDTTDAIWGGAGDDVILGDNGLVLRNGEANRTSTTDRVGSTAGQRMTPRQITLYDLNGPNFLQTPARAIAGDDFLSGGSEVDVMYGQDGNDQMSGGPGADYMEGNGGTDNMRGDKLLADNTGHVAVPLIADPGWPGLASTVASGDREGNTANPDGQDDMIGGSSMQAFRDAGDNIEGDGEGDFQLGDNGTLKRTLINTGGVITEKIFTKRYAVPAPANAVVLRSHDPAVPNATGTTRFCVPSGTTCEPAGAFGNDTMWGDGGDDTMWGQDGNDEMHGGTENDNMYGELGDDTMFGDDGNDAIIADRGGIVDSLQNGSNLLVDSTNNPPKETYTAFRNGTMDHRFDLLHDIDGDQFVGTSSSAPMPHPGLNEGGNDKVRGGNGSDNIHLGFGDDLGNGDSGGDILFGDDGTDVMWGGQGCDAVLDVATPDCLTNGKFDPTSRGTNDRFVDHLFGGVGGTSAVSKKDASGSDIMDWRPRGSYPSNCANAEFPVTTVDSKKNPVTVDPCSWFQMTSMDDVPTVNDQHHQGTDWMYGGWDRDVMQGDVAQNGPNPGDRMLDWTGTYNIYSHCNSAYGGYNDVRQHSPDMQQFLFNVSYGDGAGQGANDVSTSGTSAFRELAFVYPGTDNDHSAGPAYPSTPGHFDDPNACAG